VRWENKHIARSSSLGLWLDHSFPVISVNNVQTWLDFQERWNEWLPWDTLYFVDRASRYNSC